MITCKSWGYCPEGRRVCCSECTWAKDCEAKCNPTHVDSYEQCRLAEKSTEDGEAHV